MPRKHRRAGEHEPLDLTPEEFNRPRPTPERRPRRDRARAAKRQADAQINGGIDWSVCLVPGCGRELVIFGKPEHPPRMRDHNVRLPLCLDHLFVAHAQATRHAADPTDHVAEVAARVINRRDRKSDEMHDADKRRHLRRRDGHIYFVRLNGLVKVGWSRAVEVRLRAYGPDVEVLAVYPGTLDDETHLHRQLRPVLARGREWYEDGDVVADFVKKAVAEHGEPNISVAWTRPKRRTA